MTFALVGNQNCGKTTLFNRLTGGNQHVGNFPGVTVEQKKGALIGHKNISVADLPGIYSLTPYTAEEVITRDFLLEHTDAIINIVDATNLERNLYLTLQLTELEIPIIIALNMMDEVRKNGEEINFKTIENILGIPVVPICANKGQGIKDLINCAITTTAQNRKPKQLLHFEKITECIGNQARDAGIPIPFACTALLQQNADIYKKLKISQTQYLQIKKIAQSLGDPDAALADMRYTEIERICIKAISKKQKNRQQKRSERIDRILTNKYWGIPIFLLIMLLIFTVTFGFIGPALGELCAQGISFLTAETDKALTDLHINPALHALLIDGIFTGIGSVLSFLPLIITLFFFLSILEDSGYMARVAFLMDRPLRKIGLSGKSFVPMLIGFGCSVPAILSARTLANARDRKLTILLVPFISCSAKVPIYALFTSAFFPVYLQPIIMIGLYLFGIITGIITALFFKKVLFRGEPAAFVMELPAYRLPTGKTVFMHMWEKAKEFVIKAFTVIFIANIVIWFLQTFNFSLNMVDPADSILATIGKSISVCFVPLGFQDWRAVTALITGLTAKEAVISTLAILTGAAPEALAPALYEIFQSVPAVLSFLTFTLLYTPCAAAIGTMRREFGKKSETIFSVVYQMLIAWIMAFIVYHFCKFL